MILLSVNVMPVHVNDKFEFGTTLVEETDPLIVNVIGIST